MIQEATTNDTEKALYNRVSQASAGKGFSIALGFARHKEFSKARI